MPQPQHGIFAAGATASVYLEFDVPAGALTSLSQLRPLFEAEQDDVGTSFVLGVRPSLLTQVAPTSTPQDVHDFTEPIVGPDGFTMPATQHDLALWVTGGARDHVFDTARFLLAALTNAVPGAHVAEENEGWVYQTNRDLTGFVDGTENPSTLEQRDVACVPDGQQGAGASVLLLQRWSHDVSAWEALETSEQEKIIGRTKADSEELDPKPASSHAERTDQDDCGDILRKNMAYGDVTNHGTMFVGFACEQQRMHLMLQQMAGADGGPRDELTRYTTAETGSYYVVPALDAFTA